MKPILALLLLCSPAFAADYPVVYVRSPIKQFEPPRAYPVYPLMQDFRRQTQADPESELCVVYTDGRVEVLFAAKKPDSPLGAVFDPKPSLDGKSVYFSWMKVGRGTAYKNMPGPTDLFRIDLETRKVVQLTHATGKQPWAKTLISDDMIVQNTRLMPSGLESYVQVHYTGACPLPNGKLLFTSSRNDLSRATSRITDLHTEHNQEVVLQLFRMNEDGSCVEQVGFDELRGILHPILNAFGRVIYAMLQNHGLRTNIRFWEIREANPDNSHWEPLWSGFGASSGDLSGRHWQTQLTDLTMVVVQYYSLPAESTGLGNVIAFPHKAPHGSPIRTENPPFERDRSYGFQPVDAHSLTTNQPGTNIPWADSGDTGKWSIGHPQAAPANACLFTLGEFYTAKEINHEHRIAKQTGVYVIPDASTPFTREQLVKVVDDPAYWESQPHPLVSFKDIYGHDAPVIPDTPNPTAEPFGWVGTSGVYERETKVPKPGPNDNPNIIAIGGDVGEYANEDIHAARILIQHPTPRMDPKQLWEATGLERMSVLGEIPLRKTDERGNVIRDSIGNPDTSFLAKIPADVSWTFQLVDKQGLALTQSMTWHQLRPGEKRTDCRGCHAHHKPGIEFEGTAASKADYVVADFTNVQPELVEWLRDVKPILERNHCYDCHSVGVDGGPAAGFDLALVPKMIREKNPTLIKPFRARISPFMQKLMGTSLGTDGAQMPKGHAPLTPAELRTIAVWIDTGAPVADSAGLFFADHIRPTVYVGSEKGTVKIGAMDVGGDVDLTISKPIGLVFERQGNIYTAKGVTVPRISGTVTDSAGNVTQFEHDVDFTSPPVDPDPPPKPKPRIVIYGLKPDDVQIEFADEK